MPASAKIHSKLTVFKLDNAAGSLTDISDSLHEVTLSEELEEVECTTFGATSRAYLAGFAEGTIDLGGHWNRTLDGHLSGVYSGFRAGTITSVSFEYGPEGSDTGDVKITGEAILLTYEKASSIADPVAFTASLRVTGAVTVSAY